MVQDQTTGAILFQKNPDAVLPIASITKLMTAMVVLDAKPDLAEVLAIGDEDVDTLKGTRSRLKVGTLLGREEMLRLALMSSETAPHPPVAPLSGRARGIRRRDEPEGAVPGPVRYAFSRMPPD
jgi:hypothetical protein